MSNSFTNSSNSSSNAFNNLTNLSTNVEPTDSPIWICPTAWPTTSPAYPKTPTISLFPKTSPTPPSSSEISDSNWFCPSLKPCNEKQNGNFLKMCVKSVRQRNLCAWEGVKSSFVYGDVRKRDQIIDLSDGVEVPLGISARRVLGKLIIADFTLLTVLFSIVLMFCESWIFNLEKVQAQKFLELFPEWLHFSQEL